MANIDIKIVYDTREKDCSYIKYAQLDKRRRKDGSKIIEIEQKTVVPLGCDKSTGDITFEWKYETEDDTEWKKTSFVCELKKGLDIFTSINTKASFDRLIREIDRAKDAKLDFYFISDSDIGSLVDKIEKLEKNPRNKIRINSHISFVDRYLKLNEELVDRGYKQGILCCYNLWFLIRRLVKLHIKNKKIK